MRVGVVGAGLSGLLCAQRLVALADGPIQLSLFEWGRGPGGRTARKRVALGDGTELKPGAETLSFDHAAPCFKATSPEFKGMLRVWEQDGAAAKWDGAAGDNVWIGTPSNHAICRRLAERLAGAGGELLYGRHVRSARHDAASGEWVVHAMNRADGADEEHRFDALVFSDKLLLLPNPYNVLAPKDWGPLALPPTLESTGTVVLMLAFERAWDGSVPPLIDLYQEPEDASRRRVLGRLYHDSAKPGRAAGEGAPDLWVAHSTATYATEHLKADRGGGPELDDAAAVLAEMKTAALAALAAAAAGSSCAGTDGAPVPVAPPLLHASVFAWDHAQVAEESRLPESHLLDATRRAGVCGDFFADAAPGDDETGYVGAEAAAMSGRALASALAEVLWPKVR